MIPVIFAKTAGIAAKTAKTAGIGVGRSLLSGAHVQAGVQIHPGDIRDLNRAFRRVDKALSKDLGQVHRRIGEIVIDQLGGKATGVGTGRGERIRPSAAADRIQLLVGGGHRAPDPRKLQWGRVQKWPGGQAPRRPHIIGAAIAVEDRIIREYRDEIHKIGRRAGFGTGSRLGI